jgi:hypothetical protein
MPTNVLVLLVAFVGFLLLAGLLAWFLRRVDDDAPKPRLQEARGSWFPWRPNHQP